MASGVEYSQRQPCKAPGASGKGCERGNGGQGCLRAVSVRAGGLAGPSGVVAPRGRGTDHESSWTPWIVLRARPSTIAQRLFPTQLRHRRHRGHPQHRARGDPGRRFPLPDAGSASSPARQRSGQAARRRRFWSQGPPGWFRMQRLCARPTHQRQQPAASVLGAVAGRDA